MSTHVYIRQRGDGAEFPPRENPTIVARAPQAKSIERTNARPAESIGQRSHPGRSLESGIAFWPNLPGAGVRREVAARQRVVKRNASVGETAHARVPARRAVGDRS